MSREIRITLPKAEYCELQMVALRVVEIDHEARQTAIEIGKRQAVAIEKRNRLYQALSMAHGFDPSLVWHANDDTCELIAIVADEAPADA